MRQNVAAWKRSYHDFSLERALFRDLKRPGSLAANPLAAAALSRLGSATTLRTRVRVLAERFRQLDLSSAGQDVARRRFEIVVRCDLEGEKAEAVARDLGISPRQLRRERKVARQRIVEAMLEERAEKIDAALPDPAAIVVANAARLYSSGETQLALAALRSIAAEAGAPEMRINALALSAEIENQVGSREEAERTLREARRLMREPLRDDAAAHFCRARIDLAHRSLDRTAGRFAEAALRERRAIDELDSSAALRLPAARELLTAALLERAEYSLTDASGKRDLERAVRLIAQDQRYSSPLAIDAAILQLSDALRSGAYAVAEVVLQRALELAYQQGLADRAVYAATYLVQLHYLRGECAGAASEARRCVVYAQRLGLPAPLARAALVAAQLELFRGDAAAAKPLLALAARHVARDSYLGLLFEIETAHLRLVERRYRSALRTTQIAERLASQLHSDAERGHALLLAARSQFALGDRKRAAEAIIESVDLLEQHGGPFLTALAYLDLAQITGRPKYAGVARELFPYTLLSQPGGQTVAGNGGTIRLPAPFPPEMLLK
ncbi:MAG: hypothetical protein WBV40_08335 [Candidatus Cybelea sp.]|jgi:hypothetical protein